MIPKSHCKVKGLNTDSGVVIHIVLSIESAIIKKNPTMMIIGDLVLNVDKFLFTKTQPMAKPYSIVNKPIIIQGSDSD